MDFKRGVCLKDMTKRLKTGSKENGNTRGKNKSSFQGRAEDVAGMFGIRITYPEVSTASKIAMLNNIEKLSTSEGELHACYLVNEFAECPPFDNHTSSDLFGRLISFIINGFWNIPSNVSIKSWKRIERHCKNRITEKISTMLAYSLLENVLFFAECKDKNPKKIANYLVFAHNLFIQQIAEKVGLTKKRIVEELRLKPENFWTYTSKFTFDQCIDILQLAIQNSNDVKRMEGLPSGLMENDIVTLLNLTANILNRMPERMKEGIKLWHPNDIEQLQIDIISALGWNMHIS